MLSIGVDLVTVESIRVLPGDALAKLFRDFELRDGNPERQAGVFAAKEAFFKALGQKENWHEVWIEHEVSGKPVLKSTLLAQNQNAQVTISHAAGLALAMVLIETPLADGDIT